MDLSFSAEDEAFRAELRAGLEEIFSDDLRRQTALSKNGYLDKEGQVKWQKRLNDKGWLVPNWPEEHGGPGWTPTQKYIYEMETSRLGTPQVSPMGVAMVAPVIMAFGSDEQKAQHLPKILTSDIWWCQGYSEPGSGSDLASLSMSAVKDGDDYILNGSKIWTTHAQWADWMFCLVRTSQEDKPQKGISFVLLEMDTPGIEVRPLPTLDSPAEGQQEINQVFFNDVRVPISNRIGEEGLGWTYAKYLLQFERGNANAPRLRKMAQKVRHIASQQDNGHGIPLIEDHDFQMRLAEAEMKIEALDYTEMRVFSALSAGEAMGPQSSMMKCAGTEMNQRLTELALEAAGTQATPLVEDSWAHLPGRGGSNEPLPAPEYAINVAPTYFNYRKTSIYAGSNEIQRNIMAKMLLGL